MMHDMTKGSPFRLLVLFAIPLLIGNLFQQFYNVCDTFIVGRMIGKSALAALGATGPIFFTTMGLFWGLTSGFAVITAQRYGAHDVAGIRRSIAISVMLSTVSTILYLLITMPLLMPLMRLMEVPEESMQDGYWYIAIVCGGAGVMVFYNTVSCILRAFGDSLTPLIFLAVACIINIVLDILFIWGFGWGVAGVAIATVLAQLIAGAMCLVYARRKYRLLRLRRRDWRWDPAFVWEHIRVAVPMAIQFTVLGIGGFAQQWALNKLGPDPIAAFAVGVRIDQLALQPVFSFGLAMATFSAQNYGAGYKERIRQGLRQCMAIIAGICAAGCVFMVMCHTWLAGIFFEGDEPAVTELISTFLLINCFAYILLGMIVVIRNTLQGMGHSFVAMLSGGLELCCRLFGAFVLAEMFGFIGICAAGPLAWLAGLLPLLLIYLYVMRNYHPLPRGLENALRAMNAAPATAAVATVPALVSAPVPTPVPVSAPAPVSAAAQAPSPLPAQDAASPSECASDAPGCGE